MADLIASLVDQIIAGTPLDREQADRLTRVEPERYLDLFRGATRIREHFLGKRVRCCSIVAAKVGRCSEDCSFCSQSAHYETPVKGLTVLQRDQVMEAADRAADDGADSFGIVNSGYGPTDEEIEHWGRSIQRIRAAGRVRACASLGVLTEKQAERMAELGVQRSNHNLQTSRRFFPNIIKTHDYDDRLQTLHRMKRAGISVCSGGLFGMGETWADRVDLAFELRDVGVDVVPINFLVPIDGTPLGEVEPMAPMECLKIIAVYRFLLPDKEIKIAGGREVHLRDLQSWIFFAGADSFLIGNYLTTCGRTAAVDRQMVRDLGLEMDGFEEPSEAMAGAGVEYLKHVT